MCASRRALTGTPRETAAGRSSSIVTFVVPALSSVVEPIADANRIVATSASAIEAVKILNGPRALAKPTAFPNPRRTVSVRPSTERSAVAANGTDCTSPFIAPAGKVTVAGANAA